MSKTLEFIAQYASETESASKSFTEWLVDKLEAIRAEERTAIEEIAREISNQYKMESTAAVAIEQLVNAIRARGAK